jgi:putative YhdH/YhfP family quinone oxidoreductase
VHLGVHERPDPVGEVVIDVHSSALNFKDTLVARMDSRVRRADELILGCEAAGCVLASSDPKFSVGDPVIAYGSDVGVGRDGGFATRLAVPSDLVAPLGESFTSQLAMAYGLAAHTALVSIEAAEETMTVGEPLLVTGASGGVGSLAVLLAARRGHHVVASSGSPEHANWLFDHGAKEVIGRDEIGDHAARTLGTPRWAGAVDCIGAETLHQVLRTLRYGATVAASGLVRGPQLVGDLYPFITRAVRLVGVDVVNCAPEQRRRVWRELSRLVRDTDVDLIETTIGLADVPEGLVRLSEGRTRGRWLIDPTR